MNIAALTLYTPTDTAPSSINSTVLSFILIAWDLVSYKVVDVIQLARCKIFLPTAECHDLVFAGQSTALSLVYGRTTGT
jgi:hypothetical protein